MKTQAIVVLKSNNKWGYPLVTFETTFPRYILAEVNTHNMISKSSASSRAIPFMINVKKVDSEPFVPEKWQKDHKGMQGNEYLEGESATRFAPNTWLRAKNNAITEAEFLNRHIGVTKQLANRLLEPFMWHKALLSATDIENFFALRAHPAAEDNMQKLAYAMLEAYNNAPVQYLEDGEWHLPYGNNFDDDKLETLLHGPFRASYVRKEGDKNQAKIEISTARCARTSYNVFGESDNYEKDILLTEGLGAMGHFSPMQHPARSMNEHEFFACKRTKTINSQDELDTYIGKENPDHYEIDGTINGTTYITEYGWLGQYRGWIQYRKLWDNENRRDNRVLS